MTAAGNGRAAAFLCRVGLLAGILAVIAGIFGMHIMTGNHAMHNPSAVAATAGAAAHAGAAAPDVHTGHQAAGTTTADPSPVVATGVASGESCPCSGNCTSMHAMTAPCTPSASSGSLAAPLPGTTVLAFTFNPSVASTVAGLYSYLPGSPSPGELSISRT
ncbi:hypothetical protein V3C33_16025 [Micrococcaceae bacterium Sec5.7]